jgi:glyoxylase-like metal-dependent hydrolase (beta-lactamase superfamily II)
MTIHILNGFTCNARIPRHWECGTVELLVETSTGWVLVDTGLGTEDYLHHSGILKVFRVVTRVPLDPKEAVIRQVVRLGIQPEAVQDIVLTHMHFDHCGGLPDFPHARVHVYQKEYEAFLQRPCQFADLAYVRRHAAHKPKWSFYEDTDERWYDFNAIRLPFEPEMWLVPLPGHTRGLCGVAIKTAVGWLFQASDAAALFNTEAPGWLIRLGLGPHQPHIARFAADHPEVTVLTGHMWLKWFHENRVLEEEDRVFQV